MPDPKWLTVRNRIAADIRAGIHPIGTRIPTASDLMGADGAWTGRHHTHDADRNTIRRATTYLRDIGVLESRPGDGMYVASVPPEHLPELGRQPTLHERVTALEEWRRQMERERPPAE